MLGVQKFIIWGFKVLGLRFKGPRGVSDLEFRIYNLGFRLIRI